MRRGTRALLMAGMVSLAGCAIVGPVIDRSMRRAPNQACSQFGRQLEPGQAQCFSLFRRGASGGFVATDSTRLQPGEELFAVKSGSPECSGEFTHLAVEGDTTGPGALRIEVADAVGRSTVGRTVRWERDRADARWTVGGIDSPLQIPGNVRMQLLEGDMTLEQVCFAGYGF
jgi:hypothetical protein